MISKEEIFSKSAENHGRTSFCFAGLCGAAIFGVFVALGKLWRMGAFRFLAAFAANITQCVATAFLYHETTW
jgi:hypothetical protein